MPSIPLGPLNLGSAATGFTDLVAKVFTGATLSASVSLTESPAPSGRYSGTFTSPATAATYDGPIQDAGGIEYGTIDTFTTDSAGELVDPPVTLPSPPPTGYGTGTVVVTFAAAAAATGAPPPAAGAISFRRGDTVSIAITGMGSLVGRSKLWFTAKNTATYITDNDASSVIQITEAGGLVVLNGAVYATTTDGSLTVTDAAAGNATIFIKAAATAQLFVTDNYMYDIQMMDGSGVVTTISLSTAQVVADVTKAVS